MTDPDVQEYETADVAGTERVAAALAASLAGGECVALDGDLGAGKTQFVRGLVAGLGGEPRQVSSPTYVLLHVYRQGANGPAAAGDSAGGEGAGRPMRLTVYHLDAYRTSGPDELEAIGFSELLDQGGVVVIEWAARIADLLPADRIEVEIAAEGETARRITVRRPGRAGREAAGTGGGEGEHEGAKSRRGHEAGGV